jgi:DNA invertase Pin-like site-specific DNA recombinase
VSTIAAYIRVSSRGQDLESQRAAIVRAAAARGDRVTRWYAEKLNASTIARAALTQLREDVRAGLVSKVYVFRIDRLTRSGIRDTLQVVDEMRLHGCSLASVSDGFDLEGPASEVVLAVLAWAAQMERRALGDRISAARARVEAAGGQWGRRSAVGPGMVERVRAMRERGRSIRAISAALKIPRSTIFDVLSGKGHYKPKLAGAEKRTVARPSV